MNASVRKQEFEKADLLGHSLDELACNQCGGAFCGMRVGRVLDGEPLIMCSRKDEVREILESLARR